MDAHAAHYETVRERQDLDRVQFDLGPLSERALRRRFVAVDDHEIAATALDRSTLVCMGVGMTGPPHLGTVGQLLTAIELQEAGLDVQFVLADLEPYHGGGNRERIAPLARRYRQFALDLGFDPDRGILRTQSAATDVMTTGHRLARYYRPEAWDDVVDGHETAWEREVEALYEREESAAGSDGAGSEAAGLHSAVLHGADFLHPLCEQGYEQVLLAFGVDEHDLTPWSRTFRDAAGVSGRIGGIYTRMVPGFEGVPKQSKSIDAGVSMAAAPSAIRDRVAGARDASDPATSVAFQAMCLASRYDADRLDSLAAACADRGERWNSARREYAEYVAGLAELWQATGQ